MSEPLSLSERMQLIAELNSGAPPNQMPSESTRVVAQAIALGFDRFRISEHDHRLALERGQKSRT